MLTRDFLIFAGLWIFISGSANVAKEIDIAKVDFNKILKIPEACRNQTLCTIKPQGYDKLEKYFQQILPKALKSTATFSQRDGEELYPSGKIYDNNGHQCPYTKELLRPYFNGVANEVYIQTTSMEQYFTQVVCARRSIEVGENGEECFQKHGFYSTDHVKPTCKPVFTRQTAYVFNLNNKSILMRQIEVPSCCKCTLTDINDK